MGPLSHGKYLSWWILTLCIDSLWQHTPTDTKWFKILKLVPKLHSLNLLFTIPMAVENVLIILILLELNCIPLFQRESGTNMFNHAKSWTHVTPASHSEQGEREFYFFVFLSKDPESTTCYTAGPPAVGWSGHFTATSVSGWLLARNVTNSIWTLLPWN